MLAILFDQIKILAAVTLDLLGRLLLFLRHAGIDEPVAALEECLATNLPAVGGDLALIRLGIVIPHITSEEATTAGSKPAHRISRRWTAGSCRRGLRRRLHRELG